MFVSIATPCIFRTAGHPPQPKVCPTLRQKSKFSRASETLMVKATTPQFSKKKPSDEELKSMGVKQWPIWTCGKSVFDWHYSEKETCYLLEGDVTVTDSKSGEKISFGAGDLVEFAEGLGCVWDVRVPVKKHYKFG
mmetsp:Transcript_5583/g.9652  ORF Transcript_5583/g.9652 Transcript_5583/m.9652 type:complete len:136 (+) Transcript_5583:32-439(+)